MLKSEVEGLDYVWVLLLIYMVDFLFHQYVWM